jgi:hypothetical protein
MLVIAKLMVGFSGSWLPSGPAEVSGGGGGGKTMTCCGILPVPACYGPASLNVL